MQSVIYVVWAKSLEWTTIAFLALDIAVKTVDMERGGRVHVLEEARFIRFRRSTHLSCLNVDAASWHDSDLSRYEMPQKRQLFD